MLILIVLIVLIGVYFYIQFRQRQRLSVYLTDHYMMIDEPIPVCGAPDVIWIDQSGTLYVGDYKSRDSCKVQQSDVIQLSVYRLLLSRTQPRRVSSKGYIHLKNGRWVRVSLLSEKQVSDLYNKFQQIVHNKSQCRRTKNERYCKYCRYQDIC